MSCFFCHMLKICGGEKGRMSDPIGTFLQEPSHEGGVGQSGVFLALDAFRNATVFLRPRARVARSIPAEGMTTLT